MGSGLDCRGLPLAYSSTFFAQLICPTCRYGGIAPRKIHHSEFIGCLHDYVQVVSIIPDQHSQMADGKNCIKLLEGRSIVLAKARQLTKRSAPNMTRDRRVELPAT